MAKLWRQFSQIAEVEDKQMSTYFLEEEEFFSKPDLTKKIG